MNSFLISLSSGLVLAFLSGISYLAIKHYNVYKDIYLKLLSLLIILFLCFHSWHFGRQQAIYKIAAYAASKNIDLDIAQFAYSMAFAWYPSLILIFLTCYIYFLLYLGYRIKVKNAQNIQ